MAKQMKMDKHLIASKQKWEVLYIRLLFYKLNQDDTISHPETDLIKQLCKEKNNSRRRIYTELLNLGYKKGHPLVLNI